MSRKRELTWHKHRSCYRKVYKGQTHYLKSPCRGKSDNDGYAKAVDEWLAVKAYADGQGPDPYAGGQWNPAEYQRRYATWLIVQNEAHYKPQADNAGNHYVFATNYASHAFSQTTSIVPGSPDIGLDDLVAKFLKHRQVKATTGNVSIKQYGQDRSKLIDFQGFCKRFNKAKLSDIDGPFLTFYRECQETLTNHPKPDERISGETARKRLQTVMKLWRWAYQQEYLDKLPRVFDVGSGYATIEIARPRPLFWTVGEIRKLFKEASNRTKLYIALAANCGYTQREISTLTWEMIDRKKLEIRRERPKSGQPQVHVLWPVTYDLLRKESTSKTGLCLMGAKGHELLTERIRDDGCITHVDAIRLAFLRTLSKTKMAGKRSFKHIRKTSANAIGQEYEDNRLVDLFLAHSTRGQMREHYAEQHYRNYFAALNWLCDFYDLKSHL